MQLIPDWAPNIHPLIIHFPIVVLSLAVFSHFLEILLAKEWIGKATIWLYVFGTLSALAAVLSGRAAADSVNPPFQAELTMSSHSDMAHYTLWFFLAFTIAQLVVLKYVKTKQRLAKVILFLVACGGLYLLFQTGDLGGKLVYKYGVGISK